MTLPFHCACGAVGVHGFVGSNSTAMSKMPRLITPRSTRTMYGTVTLFVVVVDATDAAGVVPVTYGWKQWLAGVVGFGFAMVGVGSGTALFTQPPSAPLF